MTWLLLAVFNALGAIFNLVVIVLGMGAWYNVVAMIAGSLLAAFCVWQFETDR